MESVRADRRARESQDHRKRARRMESTRQRNPSSCSAPAWTRRQCPILHVERYLGAFAKIVVDLYSWTSHIRIGWIRSQIVVDQLRIRGLRNKFLNLCGNRIKPILRNCIVGKCIPNTQAVDNALGLRIIDRAFHDEAAKRVFPELAPRQRLAEIAFAIRKSGN
jgi:hypothetical protein